VKYSIYNGIGIRMVVCEYVQVGMCGSNGSDIRCWQRQWRYVVRYAVELLKRSRYMEL